MAQFSDDPRCKHCVLVDTPPETSRRIVCSWFENTATCRVWRAPHALQAQLDADCHERTRAESSSGSDGSDGTLDTDAASLRSRRQHKARGRSTGILSATSRVDGAKRAISHANGSLRKWIAEFDCHVERDFAVQMINAEFRTDENMVISAQPYDFEGGWTLNNGFTDTAEDMTGKRLEEATLTQFLDWAQAPHHIRKSWVTGNLQEHTLDEELVASVRTGLLTLLESVRKCARADAARLRQHPEPRPHSLRKSTSVESLGSTYKQHGGTPLPPTSMSSPSYAAIASTPSPRAGRTSSKKHSKITQPPLVRAVSAPIGYGPPHQSLQRRQASFDARTAAAEDLQSEAPPPAAEGSPPQLSDPGEHIQAYDYSDTTLLSMPTVWPPFAAAMHGWCSCAAHPGLHRIQPDIDGFFAHIKSTSATEHALPQVVVLKNRYAVDAMLLDRTRHQEATSAGTKLNAKLAAFPAQLHPTQARRPCDTPSGHPLHLRKWGTWARFLGIAPPVDDSYSSPRPSSFTGTAGNEQFGLRAWDMQLCQEVYLRVNTHRKQHQLEKRAMRQLPHFAAKVLDSFCVCTIDALQDQAPRHLDLQQQYSVKSDDTGASLISEGSRAVRAEADPAAFVEVWQPEQLHGPPGAQQLAKVFLDIQRSAGGPADFEGLPQPMRSWVQASASMQSDDAHELGGGGLLTPLHGQRIPRNVFDSIASSTCFVTVVEPSDLCGSLDCVSRSPAWQAQRAVGVTGPSFDMLRCFYQIVVGTSDMHHLNLVHGSVAPQFFARFSGAPANFHVRSRFKDDHSFSGTAAQSPAFVLAAFQEVHEASCHVAEKASAGAVWKCTSFSTVRVRGDSARLGALHPADASYTSPAIARCRHFEAAQTGLVPDISEVVISAAVSDMRAAASMHGTYDADAHDKPTRIPSIVHVADPSDDIFCVGLLAINIFCGCDPPWLRILLQPAASGRKSFSLAEVAATSSLESSMTVEHDYLLSAICRDAVVSIPGGTRAAGHSPASSPQAALQNAYAPLASEVHIHTVQAREYLYDSTPLGYSDALYRCIACLSADGDRLIATVNGHHPQSCVPQHFMKRLLPSFINMQADAFMQVLEDEVFDTTPALPQRKIGDCQVLCVIASPTTEEAAASSENAAASRRFRITNQHRELEIINEMFEKGICQATQVATLEKLKSDLLQYKPTVVQFNGHGSQQPLYQNSMSAGTFEGFLAFEDPTRRSLAGSSSPAPVSASEFASVLRAHNTSLANPDERIKCVVLHACDSLRTAIQVVQELGDVVCLAWQGEVENEAVLAFSVHFNYDLTLHLKHSSQKQAFGNAERLELLPSEVAHRAAQSGAGMPRNGRDSNQAEDEDSLWLQYMRELRNPGHHRYANPAYFKSPALAPQLLLGGLELPPLSLSTSIAGTNSEASDSKSHSTESGPSPALVRAMLASDIPDPKSAPFAFRHSFRVALRGMERLGYPTGMLGTSVPRRTQLTELESKTVGKYGVKVRDSRRPRAEAARPMFVHQGNLDAARHFPVSVSIVDAERGSIKQPKRAASNYGSG